MATQTLDRTKVPNRSGRPRNDYQTTGRSLHGLNNPVDGVESRVRRSDPWCNEPKSIESTIVRLNKVSESTEDAVGDDPYGHAAMGFVGCSQNQFYAVVVSLPKNSSVGK
jgi:hypothetical protein